MMDKRTSKRWRRKLRNSNERQKIIELCALNYEQKKRMKALMNLWQQNLSCLPTSYHRSAMASAISAAIKLEKQGRIRSFRHGDEYIAQTYAANLSLMEKAFEIDLTAFKDFELLGGR